MSRQLAPAVHAASASTSVPLPSNGVVASNGAADASVVAADRQGATVALGGTTGAAGEAGAAAIQRNGEGGQNPITEEEVVGYREQDRFLPINNIQRLMKRALPDTSKISKDAKECIQEATSEFISFITSEAADRATNEKRKTITGDDILYALKTLGFDEMSEVLLIYLAKYRELQNKEPARKRQRKPSKKEEEVLAAAAAAASASMPGAVPQSHNGNHNGVYHGAEDSTESTDIEVTSAGTLSQN